MINQRMIDEGARALAERVGKGTPDAFRGASEAVLLAALSGRSDPPHQTRANVDDLTRRLLDVLDNEEELSDEVLEAFKALDNAVSAQPPSPLLETDRERDIADIQKLAGMVGATFIPNAQPSPSTQMVGVKPLEWNPYRAETPFGWYDINDQSDLPESELNGRPPFLLCGSRMDYSRHKTLDAARSAAQADYEARIRAALTTEGQP